MANGHRWPPASSSWAIRMKRASCRPARSPTSSGSMARIWRTGSCMRMWRASGSISTKRASSIPAARRSWPPSSLEDGRTARRWDCRRIMRRGLPYGEYTPPDQPARDADEHGIVFMALGASLFRQFEFVQQQWIEYGNDARLGNDKAPLVGCHNHADDRFVVQGSSGPGNTPFICGGLPNFVEMRGGEYFFLPSLTALRLIADGAVDPR